jgi:hypothetical protein
MQSALFSRASLVVALTTGLGLAAAYATSGSTIFSPGGLHAGDSGSTLLGGVSSHAALESRCGECHAGPLSGRPMADRCLTCHLDIQAELRDTSTLHGGLQNAQACIQCHTEHLGATGALTRLQGLGDAHAQFGFALDAHVTTANRAAFTCPDCHDAGSFRFEARRCESCHRDYQRSFVDQHVAAWGSECQACHDGRDRFGAGGFAHDTTRFPLDGGHLTATCTSCHTRAKRLADFAEAPTTCFECHRAEDTHRGSFGTDCASCHTTQTWEGATFDHDKFPIDHGARDPSPCKTCHTDAKDYKSYTCYGCHEHTPSRVQAQHRGEVRTTNLDDCVQCHGGGRGGEEGEERRRGGGVRRERSER